MKRNSSFGSASFTQPSRVRLRRDFDLRLIEGEAAYLVSERGVTVLEGELAMRVAQLLDQERTAEEIEALLADRYPGGRVRQVLDQLVAAGLVVRADDDVAKALAGDAGFYEMAGLDPAAVGRRLADARVTILCLGDVDGAELVDQLRNAGVGQVEAVVGPSERACGADLAVVLTEDYLRRELEILNRSALDTGTPWLLARPVGSIVWVGPVFRPGTTACWTCLAHRIAANREGHSYVQQRLGDADRLRTSGARLGVGASIGEGLVALEALKVLSGLPPTDNCLVTLDLLDGQFRRHAVSRRPQCPVCGDASMMAARALEPVRFSSRPKAATNDGGHRSAAPETILERFAPEVSPISGVVTSLERVPTRLGPLHVFTAGQNLARRPRDLRALRQGLRGSSCGKGMSETQARASAIGEAIERSSGVFQGDEFRRSGSRAEMGEAAIHPNACLLFSERQYEQRHLWNLGEPGFSQVYDPFDEAASIEWSPVWSVTNDRPRWLPTQYLYYDYPVSGHRYAYADSNGCAAGSSLEDAALQGVCELAERDGVALWWYNRARRPGVDLDSFHDPYIDRLRETYSGFGREVWALDLTSDLGIPVIGAFSRAVGAEQEDILIAFGCHLDARIALVRALTEMNQFLTAVLPLADGTPAHFPDAAFANWRRTATLANQPHLVPHGRLKPTKAGGWGRQVTDDLAADLAHCQQVLEARGLELLVLDQTRPDVGLPVVKVIVPGLRHFWPRFAPGRLYDVPVDLGWRSRPLDERQLNPVAVFI